jgi:hypothetical protein
MLYYTSEPLLSSAAAIHETVGVLALAVALPHFLRGRALRGQE